MRKKKFVVFGLLAFTIFGTFAFVVGAPLRYYPEISPKKMQNKVNAETPLGTNLTKVISFLELNRIEYSYQTTEKTIYAIVRDACWTAMGECSIDMVFLFDQTGTLISSSVNEGLTVL
jgi:hypothetical protein